MWHLWLTAEPSSTTHRSFHRLTAKNKHELVPSAKETPDAHGVSVLQGFCSSCFISLPTHLSHVYACVWRESSISCEIRERNETPKWTALHSWAIIEPQRCNWRNLFFFLPHCKLYFLQRPPTFGWSLYGARCWTRIELFAVGFGLWFFLVWDGCLFSPFLSISSPLLPSSIAFYNILITYFCTTCAAPATFQLHN